MKKIIIIVLLLSFSTLISQNISLKASYTKKLTKPIISLSEKDYEKKQLLQGIENKSIELLKEIKFELLVKDRKSIFYVSNKNLLDSETFYGAAVGLGINLKGNFYSDFDKNEILNQKESFGEFFIVKGELNEYKWILHNETKLIGRFLCYKATAIEEIKNPISNKIMRNLITCWYTPEIPIKCGIGKYTNVPGLVVMIENDNSSVTLNEVILNPKNAIKIIKPTKGKIITIEEFNNIGKEMKRNF